MAIEVQCLCGQRLKARDEFAGKRGECSFCGRILLIPQRTAPQAQPAAPAVAAAAPGPVQEEALQITEYLDPPSAPIPKKERPQYLRMMFEALLDPRSIQWMLILGGGLAVLALLIGLAMQGIFENPWVVAGVMGAGTLAILGAGSWVVLKTRFRVAGQAITFLGCVVAPLNLWFYEHASLKPFTLDSLLWVGGVVCCLLYIGTVYVLKDPLFMYAVEAGVTLTGVLLLGPFSTGGQEVTTGLSLVLMVLGVVSIHGERAFPPEVDTFNRRRFGMPLFWSGHVQIGASLAVLLGTQIFGWLAKNGFFGLAPWENLLTREEFSWLPTGLWLAATYAYLYSDLAVRRVGIYTYVAAFCLVAAEVTVLGLNLEQQELAIAILALTALAANFIQTQVAAGSEKVSRAVPPVAMGLSILPILWGVLLHIRATSASLPDSKWKYEAGGLFVCVMLVVAICNRVSAVFCRHTTPKWSAAYFFGSGAAAMVAVAGLLRLLLAPEAALDALGPPDWAHQAPWLMLLPIGYLVAGRLWRGHTPERPLGWVAQTAAAVILVHVLAGALPLIESVVKPGEKATTNLLLGLVFAEAAVFYTLAAVFRRRSVNAYLATATACGALWQFLGYGGVPNQFYAMLYAVLGIAFLIVCRTMGIEQVEVYHSQGEKALATRGRGLAAFQMGNAVLSIALLVAFFQGLAQLAKHPNAPENYSWALLLTTIASLVAVGLVPRGTWRRTYVTSTIALAAVTFLTLTLDILLKLNGWQKLEIFCATIGVVMLVGSYVGRFREVAESREDMVSLGLWMGSMLATLPLLIAVCYWRFTDRVYSPIDELSLFAVTVLMLLTGYSWQVKSTTFFGGTALALYLVMVVVAVGWQQGQKMVPWYLGIGGLAIFGLGIALAVYREKLLQIPDRIAKREGVFRILNWR